MGVQGLWEVLEPAGQSISLTKIAVVDGFENNTSGRRAYRIGVDASIWYQHAEHSTKAGANPELRLLFFRLAKLAKLPWLVLFVFDGRERPKVKRGSRMGKSGSHNLTQKFKAMIECFGMEWRMARGEAEAELAYLNSQGIIDAIITDDVDALVFGARTLIRNPSLALTGNRKNPATDASGKKSEHHAMVFTSDRISSHPNIGLTRGGLILFAMLSGGDYDKGVKGMGPKIALGLARCGFGDRLLTAYRQGEVHFRAFLPQWRTEVNTELRTNASNLLPHRCPGSTLQSNWPEPELLRAYMEPVCSGQNAEGTAGLALRDRTDMSLPRLAQFCEDHFDEWGYRSRILERFYNFMWEGAVCHVLRRAALEADEKEKAKRIREGRPPSIREPLLPSPADGVGTTASLVQRYLNPAKKDLQEERLAAAFVRRRAPAATTFAANIPDTHPLIDSIVGKRRHLSTDKILEYRVVIRCKQLEELANKGIIGKHPEPPASGVADSSYNLPDEDGVYGTGGTKKKATKPTDRSVKRIWVAASMMRQVHPRLVEQFESEGPPRAGGRSRQAAMDDDDESDDDQFRVTGHSSSPVRPPPTQRSRAAAAPAPVPSNVSAPGPSNSAIIPQPPARLPSPPPLQRRVMYNVGDINFEERTNKNRFLFTFTDPCDPEMMVIDDTSNSAEFVEDSNLRCPTVSLAGPSCANVPHQANLALAPGFVDLDEGEDEDELPPPVSTAAQEALLNRIRGNSGGGVSRSQGSATIQRRNNRAVPAPRAALQDPVEDEETPSLFTVDQEAMIDRALGLGGPSASRKGKGKMAAGTLRKRTTSTVAVGVAGASTASISRARATATAVQGSSRPPIGTQGAVASTAGPSRRTAGASATRGGTASAPAATAMHSALDDEPLPALFAAEHEAMIDRALGIIGGPSQKRTKASVPRKRTARQASDAGSSSTAQAKRHKPGPSFSSQPASISTRPTVIATQPAVRHFLSPPPLEKSTSSYSSQPAVPRATSSFDDHVIDISDDDDSPTYTSSAKRAPMARRTNAWDMMPSSSQESRLDDVRFDFDLS